MDQELPALAARIAALPPYIPGASHPGLWKLSSNENPNPPAAAVLAAFAAALGEVNRYPDMYATALGEALADRHGVTPGQVVIGNGSVAVLGHLLTAFIEPNDEVIYPWRSFEAYPISVAAAGGTSVRIPLLPDATHDLAAMAAAVTPRTKVIILCSPNNPTGPSLTEAEVRELLMVVPGDVVVVLDEAYREYARRPGFADGLDLLGEFPNLIVLRTFSKAYGLAGLRVGYAVGAEPLIAGIRAASTPFGTNVVAQRAALEMLRREDQVEAQVAATVAERERVVTAVRAAGHEVPAADGNFFWLPLVERTEEFVRAALAAGLVVRGFAGDGVRITIGEPAANDAVIALLEAWGR